MKMNNHSVTLCTILVEESPQALPLGVACVASSIKNLSVEFPDLKVNLVDFNLEQNLSVEKITNELLSFESAIYCFSIFVWNKNLLVEVASELKKKNELEDNKALKGNYETNLANKTINNQRELFNDKKPKL